MRLLRLLFDVAAFGLPLWAPKGMYAYLAVHLFYPKALRWPLQLDHIPARYGNVHLW